MRCNPDRRGLVAALPQTPNGSAHVRCTPVAEAKLTGLERLTRRRASVGDTQQADPNPHTTRRSDHAPRHLVRIRVPLPARLMLHVVKLAHRTDSGLCHLEEGELADRLDRVRIERIRHGIHRLPP